MLLRLELSLLEAARHEHPAVLSHLLDQGLSIDQDVIRTCAKKGQSIEIFQALLDHGWDINNKALSGTTALC